MSFRPIMRMRTRFEWYGEIRVDHRKRVHRTNPIEVLHRFPAREAPNNSAELRVFFS